MDSSIEWPAEWAPVSHRAAASLLAAWEAQAAQWPDIHVTEILRRSEAADDVLLLLATGKVAEVHLAWHGDAGPSFPELHVFESVSDWLAKREVW